MFFFLFFNFSSNGRYEEPLSGLHLEMTISCLSLDLITHPLPSDIHSLILLIGSLPASLITVSISFSLIISRALDLKKSKKISNDQKLANIMPSDLKGK